MAGATMAEGEAQRLHWRLAAGQDSDILVVVFSQARVPAGKFGLERLFASTRHAGLFINQPENRWYRGEAATIDALVAEARQRTGARDIIFYGSSMGASPAVAAAARWPGSRAFAMAPDFAIGEAGSQSAAAGLDPSAGEADLAEELAAADGSRVTIAVGLFDPYDAGVAARLAEVTAPALRLIPVASSHELHDHLYSLNVIRKLIATFGRDLGALVADRGLAVAVPDWAPYRRMAGVSADLVAGRPPPPEALDGLGLVDNPGLERLRAELAVTAGDIDRGLAILAALDRRTREHPGLAGLTKRYLKEIPRRRIVLLDAAGRPDEASRVAAEAAARYPEDAGFAARVSRIAD